MIQLSSATGNRATCSCMIIARDAEETVCTCLDSVLAAGCFDRIIVVLDSRSRDNTAQILADYARMYHVAVIPYTWLSEDFSAARNEALRYADTDYGFWIDTDERLVDAKQICGLLNNPRGMAYHTQLICPGPEGDGVSTNQLRLFPLLPGVRWELPVHEQVAFSLRELGVEEKITQFRVFHYGYLTHERAWRHHNRYLRIMYNFLRRYHTQDARREYIQAQYDNARAYLGAT